jgi:hypothetical protein
MSEIRRIIQHNITWHGNEIRVCSTLPKWRIAQLVDHYRTECKLNRQPENMEALQAFLRRWLNDPDNRVFRTRPGRV